MIDDKVIEAALHAWFGDWLRESSDHLRERMRATLAAANKVRAYEAFDIEGEAYRYPDSDESLAYLLGRAVNAGLAKGAVERERVSNERDAAYIAAQIAIAGAAESAALREALKPFADVAQKFPPSKEDVRPLFVFNGVELTYGDFRKALALVRKGE